MRPREVGVRRHRARPGVTAGGVARSWGAQVSTTLQAPEPSQRWKSAQGMGRAMW